MNMTVWRNSVPMRIIKEENDLALYDASGVEEKTSVVIHGNRIMHVIGKTVASQSKDLLPPSWDEQFSKLMAVSVVGNLTQGYRMVSTFFNTRANQTEDITQNIDIHFKAVLNIKFIEKREVFGEQPEYIGFFFLFLDFQGNLWTLNILENNLREGITFVPIPLEIRVERMNLESENANRAILYDSDNNAFLFVATDSSPNHPQELYPFLVLQLLLDNNLFSLYSFGFTALRIERSFILNLFRDLYHSNDLMDKGIEDFRIYNHSGLVGASFLIILFIREGELWWGKINLLMNIVAIINPRSLGKGFSFFPRGNRTKSARN